MSYDPLASTFIVLYHNQQGDMLCRMIECHNMNEAEDIVKALSLKDVYGIISSKDVKKKYDEYLERRQ